MRWATSRGVDHLEHFLDFVTVGVQRHGRVGPLLEEPPDEALQPRLDGRERGHEDERRDHHGGFGLVAGEREERPSG
jgi:hypothetical protein